MILVYVTHIFDYAYLPRCSDTETVSWADHKKLQWSDPVAWDKLYGWHFGIKGLVSLVEVIADVRDVIRLL